MTQLKRIAYEGYENNGEIVYTIDGNDVYFTGVTGNDIAPTTINAAEQVINAISQAERRNWRNLIFHDIQTHAGYDGFKKGQYEMSRLEVNEIDGKPRVTDWEPLAQSKDLGPRNGIHDPTSLPGIPRKIFELFQGYLVDEKKN